MRKILSKTIAILCVPALLLAWRIPDINVDAGAADKKPAEKVPAAEIDKLIKQLGSGDFSERDTAAKALLKIGEEALPSLKAAMADADVETRGRAKDLYGQINESVRDAQMKAKIQITAKYGIDVLVEPHGAKREARDRQRLAGVDRNHRNAKC